MFRNQYDSDTTTWSPQGKLYQIEYAMQAVQQGSVCVALKSDTHVCACTLRRAAHELASYQRKVFRIDEHIGVAVAGLTADARVLSEHMRTECLNHRYSYDRPIQVNRLVLGVANKAQKRTQFYGRRPYGIGMLVVGADATGTHVVETCPSGNYYEYRAQAIGARSQPARTYLENHLDAFPDASVDELVRHALMAIRETIGSNDEVGITVDNIAVAVVGSTSPYRELSRTELDGIVSALPVRVRSTAPAPGSAAMEVDTTTD